MKFCDFKSMDLPLQAHIIFKNGVYLGERFEDDLLVALYGIFDFYVEVYYRLKSGEILKLISFHSDILLEPYLMKIDLMKVFLSQNAVPV